MKETHANYRSFRWLKGKVKQKKAQMEKNTRTAGIDNRTDQNFFQGRKRRAKTWPGHSEKGKKKGKKHATLQKGDHQKITNLQEKDKKMKKNHRETIVGNERPGHKRRENALTLWGEQKKKKKL